MTDAPLSVVIPTYNRAALLPRAIGSVLRECEESDEIIVVDDGSSDETGEVVKDFPRVRYVRNPRGGAGRARNRGAELARHSLIAFLDSDDEWLPGTLRLKRALMQARPDLVFCFSDFASVDPRGRLRHNTAVCWHEDPRTWDEILGTGMPLSRLSPLAAGSADPRVYIGSLALPEMNANYIFTGTMIVRREIAGQALHFGVDLPTYEDWECFGLLTLRGPCAYLEMESAVQHQHPGPRLTDADELVCTTTRLTILQRAWGSNPEFMAEHGKEYERVFGEQQRRRVRLLLKEGRAREARSEMSRIPDWPISYRMLAALPPAVTKSLVRTRGALLSVFQNGTDDRHAKGAGNHG